MPLLNLKNLLLTALLGLAAGFCSGYYTKAKFQEADRVQVAEQVISQAAKDIVIAQEINEAIVKTVTKTVANSSEIRKAAAKHLAQSQPIEEKAIAEQTPQNAGTWIKTCPDRTLDIFTVGLLNDARTNAPFGSSSGGYAESQTTSGVTFADFVDNDLEVVQQYHELATRHDALVDYVSGLIRNQAK